MLLASSDVQGLYKPPCCCCGISTRCRTDSWDCELTPAAREEVLSAFVATDSGALRPAAARPVRRPQAKPDDSNSKKLASEDDPRGSVRPLTHR